METRLSKSSFAEARIRALAATPVETLEWAWQHMGDRCCVLASMQDATVIELAMRVDRRFPVVFLDTGYHFPETWDTLRAVERTYGIDVEVIGPIRPTEADIEPGRCCDDKPALLERALEGRAGWISGVRRQQTEARSAAQLVETEKRGLTKVNPIVQWSDVDHALFVETTDIVTNPLLQQGYASIGCAPCTSPTDPEADSRSGRWSGSERTECGLHL